MRAYQEEYLRLLSETAGRDGPAGAALTPEAYIDAALEADRASQKAVERGTALLRDGLFPVLDDILAADEGELADLFEFAGRLMSGRGRDPWLHYRVHLALMDYARHTGKKAMLLRELYLVGMSLYHMDALLGSSQVQLYATRMRMYFTECASYFGTPDYESFDAETRGYVHRSMGNIALTYRGSDAASTNAKLAAVTRSIDLLSDPDVRAKTPELPWDTYLYKSHQERTALLSALRQGNVGPEAYAQVLESAQIVQSRQLAAFRERGVQPEPRWQYAYMAARYHCGAMLLPELLDGLYGLSTSRPAEDFGDQSVFAHLGAPAYYMGYSKDLTDAETSLRIRRMTERMRAYIYAVPPWDSGEFFLFSLRQFLGAYREDQAGIPFFEILQDVFASRCPKVYLRMWLLGRTAAQLTAWAVEDCPEKLTGLLQCRTAGEVRARREELCAFAMRAGRVADTGMFQFFQMESSACRGLFEEEETVLRLHPYLGSELLRKHGSTRDLADIALGHHRAFDERSGYPMDFSPRGMAVRPLLCIVSAADALVSSDRDTSARSCPWVPFDAAVDRVRSGAGTVYAPFVSALVAGPGRSEELRRRIPEWKREGLLDIYDKLARNRSEGQ